MTNTLHRYGDRTSFRDDYIVFAMCSRGKNDENARFAGHISQNPIHSKRKLPSYDLSPFNPKYGGPLVRG
jgi:hypothetical protein